MDANKTPSFLLAEVQFYCILTLKKLSWKIIYLNKKESHTTNWFQTWLWNTWYPFAMETTNFLHAFTLNGLDILSQNTNRDLPQIMHLCQIAIFSRFNLAQNRYDSKKESGSWMQIRHHSAVLLHSGTKNFILKNYIFDQKRVTHNELISNLVVKYLIPRLCHGNN